MHKQALLLLTTIVIVSLVSSFSVVAQTNAVNVESGDAESGKEIYDRICVACHGDRAQGNKELNAPKLAGQEPWYLARQLKNFATGIRGADPRDVFGMQMRPMALTLESDQDIADIVAYITSLADSTDE